MEQIPLNFEQEGNESSLSEEDLETQHIMDSDVTYKNNPEAARQLAKIRINFKKSGKPTVEPYPPLED